MSHSLPSPTQLRDACTEIAEAAAREIMRIYAGDLGVRNKADKSPVTDADHAAEQIILAGLHKLTPGTIIIAEEEVAAGRMPALDGGRPFWLVDPLDGTKEFIKRNGEFTVNIALIEGGRPTLGIVLAPATATLWRGATSLGADKREKDGPFTAIHTRPAPSQGLTACASRSHAIYSDLDIWFRNNNLNVCERVEAGSSLKFCLIAEGKADIYPRFGPTCEWDTAAGQGVLEAAGGEVVTTDGRPLTYGHSPFLNPHFIARTKGGTMTIVEPTAQSVADAARLLRDGALVAFPTETVYGLGGDATNERAVAAIFEAKGRPQFNPLISHVLDAAAARAFVRWNDMADKLAARFWPGPLTLVLPRAEGSPIALLATAGLDTVAIRAPAHPVAQALIRAAGRPIAAPSANRSGAVSPTRAEHVAESLGAKVPLILDGGPCLVGVESTVLDLSTATPTLLRPGGATREAIEAVIGPIMLSDALPAGDAAHKSPGQLASHYAPTRPVRLEATKVGADEGLLAFGPDVPAGAMLVNNLSPSGDLAEAAANLFAMMRALDRPGIGRIAVMPIPQTGLGLAINDRLRRAAADDGTDRHS